MTPNRPTLQHFHQQVIADSFSQQLSDDDAFLVFAILHTCIFVLANPLLDDAPDCREIYPLTQRGAAEVLAILWQNTPDERADYAHWYWKWNTDWDGYRHLETLSSEEKARLRILKQKFEEHPFVKQLVREEDDPLV